MENGGLNSRHKPGHRLRKLKVAIATVYVRCTTLIVRAGEMPWHNSFPCIVKTSMQSQGWLFATNESLNCMLLTGP